MVNRQSQHDGESPSVPTWDWYQKRARYRAIRMDKAFDVKGENGIVRGYAGEWLVEDHEGKNQQRYGHHEFIENFERLTDWKKIPEKDVL